MTIIRNADGTGQEETMTDKTTKTGQSVQCGYCSWIDPDSLGGDTEDGPLNFCRVCGRNLRTKITKSPRPEPGGEGKEW